MNPALYVQISIVIVLICLIAYSQIKWLLPNAIKIVLFDTSSRMKTINANIDSVNSCVTINKQTYEINSDYIYRSGLFRIPTAVFIEGKNEPIDILKLRLASKQSASEVHKKSEARIAYQIISAFKQKNISPATSMIILGVILVSGFGITYYMITKKLDELLSAIQAISPFLPVVPPS